MILDPAPWDRIGINGVSCDLVSKVDSGAAYHVVFGSGYAEMPAKDTNMEEDNGVAFHVVSAFGGDFICGYSLMLAKDNISFCIDLQNASFVHSSSCFGDGLLASHGNVQAKFMIHNLLGCVSSSTEDGREGTHIGNVLGVRSSAPCNDIDHAIDSGGVANDAEYGQGLSYIIRDGYDQSALSPCGDIPRSINSGLRGTTQSIMNRETTIENLRTGLGSRSTAVDLDGVIRSFVREVFQPLVVGLEHTIDGNIGSQPIVGSSKGKVMDVTPWKKKIGSKNDLRSTSGFHSEGIVREEFPSLVSKNKNGSLANSCWDSGRSSNLLLDAKGVQNGVFYFEEMDTFPTEIINGKNFVKIEKKLIDSCRIRWENCLLGTSWATNLIGII
ncbi:hypothetical protein AMTRI_Chr06g195890 [Amborella trichopoda]